MNEPYLVGVHGPARSGKDTLAAGLIAKGYERRSFAEPMRQALYALNPIVATDNRGRAFRLAEVVDDIGWDEAKGANGGEIRRLMQRFGTEVGRQMWGEDFWVNQALADLVFYKNYVFTDVRFENEALALAEHRPWSFLIKIKRPGVGPINNHPSDAGLPDELFDAVIINDGTIEELHTKALRAIKEGR